MKQTSGTEIIGYGSVSASRPLIPGSAEWLAQKRLDNLVEDEESKSEASDSCLVLSSACPTAKWKSITMANYQMIQSDRRTFSHGAFINTLTPIQTSFHIGDEPVFGAAFSNTVVGGHGRKVVQVTSLKFI